MGFASLYPRYDPATILPSEWSPQHAHVAQAGMPAAADDQVVVHGDAERLGGADDVAGHRDVGLRRRRIARRVVVHQDIVPSLPVADSVVSQTDLRRFKALESS